MPSKIKLMTDTPDELGIEFGLYAKDSEKAHLIGTLAYL